MDDHGKGEIAELMLNCGPQIFAKWLPESQPPSTQQKAVQALITCEDLYDPVEVQNKAIAISIGAQTMNIPKYYRLLPLLFTTSMTGCYVRYCPVGFEGQKEAKVV